MGSKVFFLIDHARLAIEVLAFGHLNVAATGREWWLSRAYILVFLGNSQFV